MSRFVPIHVGHMRGVAAGQTADIKLPNGPTYQEIVLDTNLTKDEITRVRINIGGVHGVGDIVDVSGTDLQFLETYKGRAPSGADLNRFVIPFGNIDAKVDAGEMFSGLVTLRTDNIIIYVELAGTVAAGTPDIDVWADASASQPTRTLIPMLKRTRVTNNATGQIDVTNLPKREKVKALHLYADITRTVMKLDGTDEYDRSADVNAYQLSRKKKVPQTGWFHVDFSAHGYPLADIKDVNAKFEYLLQLTLATASDIEIISDSVLFLPQDQYQSAA